MATIKSVMAANSLPNEELERVSKLSYDYLQWLKHDAEMRGCRTVTQGWWRSKSWLDAILRKMPGYIEGEYMVVRDLSFERPFDSVTINRFFEWADYGVSVPCPVMRLVHDAILHSENAYIPDKDAFVQFLNSNEYTKKDKGSWRAGQRWTTLVQHIMDKNGTSNDNEPSRDGYGNIRKDDDGNDIYKKRRDVEFAKFADAVTPKKYEWKLCISINQLDYYSASFGTNWNSCMSCDVNGVRDNVKSTTYNGCYYGGGLSYLLDAVTVVTYLLPKDATNEEKPYAGRSKIARQLFHIDEDKLIQARLYPFDQLDGSKANSNFIGLIPIIRHEVEQLFADALSVNNRWKYKRGTSKPSRIAHPHGSLYPDWMHYENCGVATLVTVPDASEEPEDSEGLNCNPIYIGATQLCIACGEEFSADDSFLCPSCSGNICCNDCGCTISEDDATYINGEYYCRDCVSYCDYHDEYEREELTYVEHYGNVCDDGLADGSFAYNEEMHEYVWYASDDAVEIDDMWWPTEQVANSYGHYNREEE